MSGVAGGGQVLNGRQQFINGSGEPLAGGQVFFYRPNTTDLVTTYQDEDYLTPNTNPVILDAAGMATVYYHDRVRQVVKDRHGNLIWDKPTGSNASFSSTLITIPTIAALRLAESPFPLVYVKGYRTAGDGGEGNFYYVESDTTSVDDGGSIIVNASGNRYYRDVEKGRGQVNVRWWGAYGDGVADDHQAVQNCFTYADSARLTPYFPSGQFYSSQALTLGGNAPGIFMDGTIVSDGGFVALTVGASGNTKNFAKQYGPIRVLRRTVSDWSSESDVGVRIYNCDGCMVDLRQSEGFTIGLQTWGDETGFEDTTVFLDKLINNKYALDVHTGTASGWNNSIRYIGGHFACSSSVNTSEDRYGVRFSKEDSGSYPRHNAHAFYGPAFELQRQGTPGTVEAIPFLFQAGDERGIHAERIRMEQCSPYVARVVAGGAVNDCVFFVSYTGTYAYKGDKVLYDTGVTRSGITVFPYHQAAAAQGTPRLFADASSVRAMAYRDTTDSATGKGFTGAFGFDKMVALSGSPNSAITNLTTGVFNGLTFVDGGSSLFTGDAVGLHSARAIAFVVDVSRCKEIFVAAEGQYMRLIVQQYDSGENILGEAYPIRISNMNSLGNFDNPPVTPPYAPMWWEGNIDLDQALEIYSGGVLVETVPDFNRLQRVQVNDNAAFAVIGVRGGQAGALLKSLRLYCAVEHAPPIIYGGGRSWGSQERAVYVESYDPGSLAPNARIFTTVAFTGARLGDIAFASFVQDTGYTSNGGYIRITAQVTAPNSVLVCFENLHPANTIDLDIGTLYVQLKKVRL